MSLPESLHFHGPFTFVDHGRGIARSEFAAAEGVYLWVLRDGDRRFIHYVGETTAFLKRHKQHLTQILGANYGIFRADAVAADDPTPVYGGMWRMKADDPLSTTVAHWRTMRGAVLAYLESLEVFFAPTDLPDQLRKHVEGRVARHLTERHPGAARFYPPDNWTQTLPAPLGVRLAVTSTRAIEGLDPEIEI
jgi:hypothetical protein